MAPFTQEEKLQFDKLKQRLNSIGEEIKSIADQGRSIKDNPSNLFLFKGMYRELKPLYDSFNGIHDTIIDMTIEKGCTSMFPQKGDKQLIQAVKRYFYEACAIYEDFMNPTPVPSMHTPVADSTVVNESRIVRARLPQINLPHFSGNPHDWPLFRDTYRALIHTEGTLSDMEKFLFLVSCLSGPARSLIANVNLIEANYSQAWKILTEYYDNNRKLANTYLKQVLEFKPLTSKPTTTSLSSVITSVIECLDSFNHLSIPDKGDFIEAYLVLRCLDPSSKIQFEKKYAGVEFPTYKNVVDFIKTEWKSTDIHYPESEKPPTIQKTFHSGPSPHRFNSIPKTSLLVGDGPQNVAKVHHQPRIVKPSKHDAPNSPCPVCQAAHNLYQCGKFRSASASEKIKLLKSWSGCLNCLSAKHSLSSCTSLRRCSKCDLCHHTWLHQDQVQSTSRPALKPPALSTTPMSPEGGVTLGSLDGKGEVLLGTAIVEARDVKGNFKNIRLVADSGSQFSFITADCAGKLGLTIEPTSHKISGIGQVHLPSILGSLNCTIRSKLPLFYQKELKTEVIVVPEITSNLPKSEIPLTIQSSFKGYALADSEFWKPSPVEFLLGGDLFFDIVMGKSIIFSPDIPRLVPTTLGYIVAGPLRTQQTSEHGSSLFLSSNENLKNVMQKFWEIEEVTPVKQSSEEDDYCENHFQTTHYRLESGRYGVSLATKESISELENTNNQAFKRLLNLEVKLNKHPQLRLEYHKFMQEYLDLGHMRKVPYGTAAYTLPHHAVVKQHNDELKLRTVFDASCKSVTGSLNDHLYTGPKLQLDIRDILTNFRVHKVVFTADMVKMYRQIQIHSSDRKYQHILWRFDPSEAVQEYELCTVTYGESSAPFNAQRTIIQLVQDEGKPYPFASRALLEDIYVDDIVTGASSENEAKMLQTEIITLLSKGCFELSKWASNCQGILDAVKESQCQVKAIDLALGDEPKLKILGMQWIPNKDVFTYNIVMPSWHPTKRAVLSAIARIYDPLGFLSPVTFYAKTLLQDMWISKCDWDEPGPKHICQKWHTFLSQLNILSDIKIPRRIICNDSESSMFLGFSDASQRGYSAVLYIRTRSALGCHIHLIRAKTKLAPIKPMTVPRLELSGALLLSRLYKSCEGLRVKLNISNAKFFTDSEIVLGWLLKPPQQMNAFVAHRVVEILELTDKAQWNFINSESNPADCSSRGILPSELPHHSLWWAGPQWIKLPLDEWPHLLIRSTALPEMKKDLGTTLAAISPSTSNLIAWMERFSKYSRLLRSLSYALRFIKGCKRLPAPKGPITIAEWRESNAICIRITQAHYKINTRHLQSLHAFHDEGGILRVGGRLQNSSLTPGAKHPIIISAKSHFAAILVDHYHMAHLHVGPNSLQAILQTKYWIVSARQLIRRRTFLCIKCYKEKNSPKPPLMGNLPAFRVKGGRVLHHVGVDFGGLFLIRESLRRKAGWNCQSRYDTD